MLLIATVDPILQNQLRHTLTEVGNPFFVLKEGKNFVDFVI